MAYSLRRSCPRCMPWWATGGVVQATVLSPLVNTGATRRLFVPALAALASGLAATPFAGSYLTLFLAVGLVAAAAGVLSPIDTYCISLIAGKNQATELGLQTAAAKSRPSTRVGYGGLPVRRRGVTGRCLHGASRNGIGRPCRGLRPPAAAASPR